MQKGAAAAAAMKEGIFTVSQVLGTRHLDPEVASTLNPLMIPQV